MERDGSGPPLSVVDLFHVFVLMLLVYFCNLYLLFVRTVSLFVKRACKQIYIYIYIYIVDLYLDVEMQSRSVFGRHPDRQGPL